MYFCLLLYFVCGMLFNPVQSATPAQKQMNDKFTSILLECLVEYPISSENLEMMTEKKQMPNNIESKCLFACVYKKTGVMDEEGKLSEEGVRELTKMYFADDAGKIKISEDFAKACMSVNEETVSDGKKGCERAMLIFDCSTKNVPDLDLV